MTSRPDTGRRFDQSTTEIPGISRLDLICGPRIRETCEQHVRRWAVDRALTAGATNRLALLATAALGHGILYGPRAVSVIMQWADPDRVRIDVRWHGATTVSRTQVSSQKVEATVALFDALTEAWGFGPGTPAAQWMVVGTNV